MSNSKNQKGFTLVEMIGVLAVIAILASVATPRILETIEDAKVSSYVQSTKTLVAAVAKFNADTGRWPYMYPTYSSTTHPHYHQLVINAINAAGDPIPGWQGPYLDTEPANPFSRGGYQALYYTSSAAWACDVDGDGNADGQFIAYRMDGISDKVAEKISNAYDGDAGTADWKTKGRLKRYNGNSTSIISNCLQRI